MIKDHLAGVKEVKQVSSFFFSPQLLKYNNLSTKCPWVSALNILKVCSKYLISVGGYNPGLR